MIELSGWGSKLSGYAMIAAIIKPVSKPTTPLIKDWGLDRLNNLANACSGLIVRYGVIKKPMMVNRAVVIAITAPCERDK